MPVRRIHILLLVILASVVCRHHQTAMALPVDYYSTESRLAAGHWVKVRIDTTGVYAISYRQLEEWGFDNPGQVGVFGSGAVAAADHIFSINYSDDLAPTAVARQQDRLLFYGEADVRAVPLSPTSISVTRNHYDTGAYYFIGECGQDAPLETLSLGSDWKLQNTITSNTAVELIEREVQIPTYGGAIAHGPQLSPGQTETFTFAITDISPSANGSVSGAVNYVYCGFRDKESEAWYPEITLSHPWQKGGHYPLICPPLSGSRLYRSVTDHVNFESGWTPGSPLEVSIAYPADYDGYFAVDRVAAIYNRKNRLGNDNWRTFDIIRADAGQTFVIDDSDISVWDVTDISRIRSFQTAETENGNTAVSIQASLGTERQRRILAFRNTGYFPQPRFEEIVEPQNLHSLTPPDILIVTTADLAEQANQLADIHRRHQGMDVLVVNHRNIYNEFGNGSHCPQAIRRFVKMLHDRDTSGKFRYLLFYGVSVADNRFISRPATDAMATFQAELETDASSNSTCYCGDAYFAMLADDYRHAEVTIQPTAITVGRLPVRDAGQARMVNAKIESYFTDPMPPAAAMRMLYTSDDGDRDAHFDHSQQSIAFLRDGRPDMLVASVDNLVYPQFASATQNADGARLVMRHINDGILGLWYTGHGGPNTLAQHQIMNQQHLAELKNKVYPFAMLATCETFTFDLNHGSIAEQMVLKPDGGFMGCIAAGRAVYLDYNRKLNHAMSQALASATYGDSFADLFYRARNAVIANERKGSGVASNVMCYNYCGDPALPLPIPSATVIPSDTMLELTSGMSATINAIIVDGQGNPTGFSGCGTLSLFDQPRQIEAANAQTKPKYITEETRLLAQYPVIAENGRISTTITAPSLANIGQSPRLAFALRSAQGSIATGLCSVSMKYSDNETSPESAPEISELYINNPDFIPGDIVGRNATLYATIVPTAAGLPGISSLESTSIRCRLDGSTNLSPSINTSFDSEGNLHLSVALTELGGGYHTVSLDITDPIGATASAATEFEVRNACKSPELIYDGQGASRHSANFRIASTNSDAYLKLIISNASGETVATIENPETDFCWNLTDNLGNIVDDGLYKAILLQRHQNELSASEPVRFVVVKP